MRSTDEYGEISWFLNHVRRVIDPVLVDPHDLFFTWSHWSYWYSGCSISWVSPLREDGASACPRDPGCSESQVSLRHEPSQGSRASSGTPWSVVGLARTVTILAVPETYGEVPWGCWWIWTSILLDIDGDGGRSGVFLGPLLGIVKVSWELSMKCKSPGLKGS